MKDTRNAIIATIVFALLALTACGPDLEARQLATRRHLDSAYAAARAENQRHLEGFIQLVALTAPGADSADPAIEPAQSSTDSLHVKAQKARLDSVRIVMDSLQRWCGVASYSTPRYLRRVCPMAVARPDRRALAAEDALLIPTLPPVVVPPANQKPVARFTWTVSNGTIYLDGRTSTDDKAVTQWDWTAPNTDRPPKTGAQTQRGWGSTDTPYIECLTVRDAEGLTSQVCQTISGPTTTPPPPVDTSTPPPVITPPPSSGTIAAAELPRVTPPSADPYPGRACSVTLPPATPITSALQAARGGDVVCLTSGATYAPFQLPARVAGDTGWIVLRTATTLPATGTRMRPSTAPALAKIVTTLNGQSALTTTPATFGWFIRGVEFMTGPTVTLVSNFLWLGDIGALQDTYAEVPQRIILSQVYVHGTPTASIQRCIALNTGATAIVDSWIGECHIKGFEGQGISGWNGPGPHLVDNSHVEAAGINALWGGATPSIPGMVAADITVRRSYFYTPVSWKTVWTKKNLFETKNAVRVLIEDSVFDGAWTDSQIGGALLFKSSNDQANCPWCRTSDVTIRRSYVTHAAGGIVLNGREAYLGGGVDSVARRFLIQDVVFDSLNVAPYTDGARGIQITSATTDITFDRVLLTGLFDTGNLLVLDPNNLSPRTAFRNSVFSHGRYAASNSLSVIGLPSMTYSLPGFEWTGMTIVRWSTLDPLPIGTTVVTSFGAAPLTATIRTTVKAAVAGVVVPP